MRAVTIAVDEISGVAGFIQRGDYVDVIAYTTTTYDPQGEANTGETEEEATEDKQQGTSVVAAQNVCVAAVGTTLKAAADTLADGTETIYSSVTLLLTPEDAMRVIQGAKSGIVTIALRASGDHTANGEEPVVSDSLLDQAN
jgi:pilus assembly protein CpaB